MFLNLLAETIALNNLPLEKTLTPDALSPKHSQQMQSKQKQKFGENINNNDNEELDYNRSNSFSLNNERTADDIFKYLDKSQYNINKPIGFGCGVGIISLESEIIHSLRHIMKVYCYY